MAPRSLEPRILEGASDSAERLGAWRATRSPEGASKPLGLIKIRMPGNARKCQVMRINVRVPVGGRIGTWREPWNGWSLGV